VALGASALLAGGCSSSLSDSYAQDQLDQARTAYQAAKADPQVEATAPDKLLEANLALQDAEKTGNPDKVSHLAYIAQRKVQTAQEMTAGKIAESQLQQMAKTNTALIMQKREREAKAAREQAAAAGHELAIVREEAQMSAAQAEQARKEAEQRQAQLTEAQKQAQQHQAELEQARLQSEQARKESEQAKAASEQARTEAMQARTEQAQLLNEMSNLKAKETERGLVLTLGDVLFETGKSDLSPRAMNSIDKLANFLNQHPDRNLMIEGFTDSKGSDQMNKLLSEKRADSVRQALVDRGVGEDRVSIKGYGKANPVASNSTRHGRQLNRRVEVIILNQGAAGGEVSH